MKCLTEVPKTPTRLKEFIQTEQEPTGNVQTILTFAKTELPDDHPDEQHVSSSCICHIGAIKLIRLREGQHSSFLHLS